MAAVPSEPASVVPANPGALRGQLTRLLPTQRSFSALVALAAAIALLAGLWMWGRVPDYRVLYTNLSERDGGAIINALQQMNVPYKMSAGGSVMVPADEVYQVRLRLASQGLPKGGTVGFEVLDNEKFGTSQFVEQVDYQRALEGELARSVQSLDAVRSARVHLAIPKQSVFVREQQKPSASVLVDLYAGRTLDSSQVTAITHLVASSVADLAAKRVTVVDQNGDLLTSQAADTAGLDPGQLKYVRAIERSYAHRIEDILVPIVGQGNVHAQVTANLDFSQTDDVSETYRPNQSPAGAAVRSEQTEFSSAPAGAPVGGIPGALSNQPPGAATAPINVTAGSSGAGKASSGAKPATRSAPAAPATSTHKESTVNYEVDKTIQHTREPVGALKRLSVAVVVNDRSVVTAGGKTSLKPLPPQEMAQITALVKDVMGYDKQRGDSLNVVNTAFTRVVPPVAPPTPLWRRPELLATAGWLGKNLLIAIVALFIALRVVAPLVRSVTTSPPLPPQELPTASAAALAAPNYQDNLQRVQQLARDEPKLVASVVKDWVSSDER